MTLLEKWRIALFVVMLVCVASIPADPGAKTLFSQVVIVISTVVALGYLIVYSKGLK